MRVIDSKIKKSELKNCEYLLDEIMVKAVVDVEKEILAIDAELHADIERELLASGSSQYSLWGINLYFDEDGEDFVEFDSLINIRPAQNNRDRFVHDVKTREKIIEVVNKWIES